MSAMLPEQRRAPRVVFISTARLSYDHDQVMEAQVDTRNISLTGLYLETEARILVDTPCTIAIQLAGATSKMDFKVEGVVCRHDRTGMAITFTRLNPDSYLHIANLVNIHAAEDR